MSTFKFYYFQYWNFETVFHAKKNSAFPINLVCYAHETKKNVIIQEDRSIHSLLFENMYCIVNVTISAFLNFIITIKNI